MAEEITPPNTDVSLDQIKSVLKKRASFYAQLPANVVEPNQVFQSTSPTTPQPSPPSPSTPSPPLLDLCHHQRKDAFLTFGLWSTDKKTVKVC